MNIGDTTVHPEDERPNRRDGTCFYCGEKIGGTHKSECVIPDRSVVVEVTLEIVLDMPRSFDVSNIEFKLNESSWCADNLIDDLAGWARKDARGVTMEPSDRPCVCPTFSAKFLREATDEDHQFLPVLINVRDGLVEAVEEWREAKRAVLDHPDWAKLGRLLKAEQKLLLTEAKK